MKKYPTRLIAIFLLLYFTVLNSSCKKKEETGPSNRGQWKLIFEFDRQNNGNVFWTDIDMVNQDIGYATASYARVADVGLYKTINGGINWNKLPNPATDLEIAWKTVFFIDANTGWAGGAGYNSSRIYKTINGGETWVKQTDRIIDGRYLFSGPLNIYFSDAQHGVATGTYGSIIYTEDGGNTWRWSNTEYDHTKGSYSTDLYGVWGIGNTFWISGTFGTVLKSTDGGKNWKTLNHSQLPVKSTALNSDRLNYIQFVDSQTGWICGNFGIYKSTDGGTNWIKLKETKGGTYGGYFMDANEGFAGGAVTEKSDLRIASYYTANGGQNWFVLESDKPQSSGDLTLFAMDFINSRKGWAICGSGAVYKYEK